MIDIDALSIKVIEQVFCSQQGIVAGVDTQSTAVNHLYSIVYKRLCARPDGSQAIAELEATPEDAALQIRAAEILGDECRRDSDLAQSLEVAVYRIKMEQDRTVFEVTTKGGASAAVGPNGNLDMRRGVLAAGNVDQSRKVTVGLGGLALAGIVVVVVALLLGALGARILGDGASEPETDTDGKPSRADCSPRPCGASGGIVAYLNNVKTGLYSNELGAKYTVMRMDWRLMNGTSRAIRYEEDFALFDDQHVRIDTATVLNGDEFDCRRTTELQIPPGSTVSSPSPVCLIYELGNHPAIVEFSFWSGSGIPVTL